MTTGKKPGWITGIGIITIILSGFGVMGGLQESLTPIMLEAQRAEYEPLIKELKELIEENEQYIEENKRYSDENDNRDDIVEYDTNIQNILPWINYFLEFFDRILNMPEWYLDWLIISGILSMLINGLYLFSAIWLMQLKSYAPKFLSIALPLSIALGITRTIMSVQAFENLAFVIMGGTIVAIIIEIILLLVLLSKDKSIFKDATAAGSQQP